MTHIAQVMLVWVLAHQSELLTTVGGSAGLCLLLEATLHKLHIENKVLAFTLQHILGAIAGVVAFYFANQNFLPSYASVVIVMGVLHRFFVSPGYTKYVLPYLTYMSERTISETTTQSATNSSVALPITGTSFVN